MEFYPKQCYHVYNQGNNRHRIFFNDENYIFFLRKIRNYLLSHCHIMAYCLMPNHFHWLIYTKDNSRIRNEESHPLIDNISILLRSYTRAINNQTNRSGSLFKQRTKASHLNSLDYAQTCLHYTHQNPVCAGLVTKMEDWPYSSYPDFAGTRNGTLPFTKFTFNYLGIDQDTFAKESNQILDSVLIEKLY